MFANIVSLQAFYQSALGMRTQHLLNAQMATLWPSLRGDHVVVLGYGVPFLQNLTRHAASVLAFMPAGQGVAPCPTSGPNISCLVDFNQLPLPDNSIDRVVLLHALEGAANSEIALGEIWRVLKGNGRLLAYVPNRMGLWAHSDHTPFGYGQPYSATQMKYLLQNNSFSIEQTAYALYAPPCTTRLCLSMGDRMEKYAARFFPALGGVVLVEASKQSLAPIYVKNKLRSPGFSLSFPTAPLLPT
jgi:SAM-dependent methyltransferase